MFAEIIVDLDVNSLDRIFTYKIPEQYHSIAVGSRVVVSFGKKILEGFVTKIKTDAGYDESKIKPILNVLDEKPLILPELLRLKDFMKSKYNLRDADCFRLFLPAGIKGNKVKPKFVKYISFNKDFTFEAACGFIRKGANQQLALLNELNQVYELELSVANEKFGASATKGLIEKNLGGIIERQVNRLDFKTDFADKQRVLTECQQNAYNQITSTQNKVFLLHGVTGSGKTEVYMRLIQNALENNKKAIMLVPEIGLTPQVMRNFVARFGNRVAVLHSGLSLGERFDEWNRIYNEEVDIVVGARSAIFAPIQNVGVIIIDEEHDQSYQSESNPRYHTHEIAKFRANQNACNLVLGSATPSIESFYKTQTQEYNLITMGTRVNGKDMPDIEIIDMRKEVRAGNTGSFSERFLQCLNDTVNKGEQAIIFLNRRGYSSYVICRECGYVAKCNNCDVSLVYHKEDKMLKCHYCGQKYHTLSQCPECQSEYIRHGYDGTQKVVEELKEKFPNTKILRMDNDNTTNKNAHEEILQEFANTKPCILVGTQMIAKGHDFPLCSFVGIVDADQCLHFSDYKATERTFALITQVSGRAGRGEVLGRALLQTHTPKHYVYNFAQKYDYVSFYNKEINLRDITKFPPFSKIVRVMATSENEQKAVETIRHIYEKICILRENNDGFIFLQVNKSPIKRIMQKFRYQIIMRIDTQKFDNLIPQIFQIVNTAPQKDTTAFVELDPNSLS